MADLFALSGRAGRDGLPSECLLLYSGADAAKWRMIVERSGEESGDVEATKAQLQLLQKKKEQVH